MSRKASPVEPAVLVTIICETVLKDRIVEMLKNHSVLRLPINQVQVRVAADGCQTCQATTPMLKLRPLCHQKYLMLSSGQKEHKAARFDRLPPE